jgi:SAM-dependent methyltransferase
MTFDVWASGDPYERFMGRWSRRMAGSFVSWLDVADDRRWLDVGCGTGALTSAILDAASPAEVLGVDPSEGFVATARDRIGDPRVRFEVGDAGRLDLPDGAYDATVGGLMLNFVPDPAVAAAELGRVTGPGGVVGAYVWDYAGGMEMLSHFWAAVAALDSAGEALDEGRRFPLCQPEPLRKLWEGTGLADVTVETLESSMIFADFDDYWMPFLGGQGPAPGYVMSLSEAGRADLRELLRSRLPTQPDGSVVLAARAWAVRGTR